jgi:hypothetical protein
MLHCGTNFAWHPDRLGPRFATTEDTTCPQCADRKEAIMELRMGLNILAAVLSLGFLAAIVFGMI